MIPPPKAHHLLAGLVFAAVAALAVLFVALEDRYSDEQVNMAANVLWHDNPDLYGSDPVFGDSGLWRFNTPVWQWYLHEAYVATGRSDAMAGFGWLAGPVVFIYLLGMYLLLWDQCRSWSISCFTAVMSTTMVFAVGGGYWGMGSLSSMTPETVYTACIPWLVWGLLRAGNSVSVLWVFLAAGLLANVHLVTGMNLTLVLILTHLGRWRFSRRAWLIAVLGGLCAAGAASPFIGHYIWARSGVEAAQGAVAGSAGWSKVVGAFQRGNLDVLYPTLLIDLLEFLPFTLVLWGPAVFVMVRMGRFGVRNLRFWLWMLAACGVVGLVCQGVSQIAGMASGSAPPIIDFVHAMRLVMLPLYVLFAQTFVHVFRLGAPKLAMRIGLAVLLAAWMLPSYNLRAPRRWVEDAISSVLPPERQLEGSLKRQLRQDQQDELRYICSYILDNTDVNDVVAAEDVRVRLWSRRALVATEADLKYLYYTAPDRLEAWGILFDRQRRVLDWQTVGPASVAEMDRFGQDNSARYLIVKGYTELSETDAVTWVQSSDGRWGQYWRLYRVRPLPANVAVAR